MEPLFSEWLTLVAGFTHPLPRGAAVSPRQLAELPLASFTGMFVSRRYIDDYCSLHGIEPRIALEANSISAVLKIIRRSNSRPSCRAQCRTNIGTCATSRSTRHFRFEQLRCSGGRARIARRPRSLFARF
jgi:hypothetical protein